MLLSQEMKGVLGIIVTLEVWSHVKIESKVAVIRNGEQKKGNQFVCGWESDYDDPVVKNLTSDEY